MFVRGGWSQSGELPACLRPRFHEPCESREDKRDLAENAEKVLIGWQAALCASDASLTNYPRQGSNLRPMV